MRRTASSFSTCTAPPAWDNVIADSPGLGYVVANHQTLRTFQDRWVWTYYRALAHDAPPAARRALLAGSWRDAANGVLADLERAHPDVRRCCRDFNRPSP